VDIDGDVEACQKAFSTVCAFIGTRDLIQEHITEAGLVRLKYTFRFRDKFDEPDDDWLKCIEATSDELLGTYSKAEDDALSAAFRGKEKD
jgi:hypothetical protein